MRILSFFILVILPIISMYDIVLAKENKKNPLEQLWIKSIVKNQVEEIKIAKLNEFDVKLKILEESDPLSEKFGVKLCWITLPIQHINMVVKDVRKNGNSNNTFQQISDRSDIVVINGGYYGYDIDDNYIPLGLVVSNGVQKNRVKKWKTGGVLYQYNNSINIAPVRNFKFSKSISNAIQSLVIVVENGHNDINRNNHRLFNRIVVCLNKEKNNLIIVGAFEKDGKALSLYEFADFITIINIFGGPDIETALALDGGPGAHIYIPNIKKHFGYDKINFVPNTIHFNLK